MKPIDLLYKELEKLRSAKAHSIKSMEKGEIDLDLHQQHLRNLNPMIEEYEEAIKTLKWIKE